MLSLGELAHTVAVDPVKKAHAQLRRDNSHRCCRSSQEGSFFTEGPGHIEIHLNNGHLPLPFMLTVSSSTWDPHPLLTGYCLSLQNFGERCRTFIYLLHGIRQHS
ncbi:hypothetical protein AVEN_90854-1 [Araneus ventricosus]|uniref:Uncharacterized protein n=1 Tax=Araneus ventricosus TaxID=182803 RepID=A0A4Y2LE11_ARAVE|nr:hypothetical protein AVEN_90854-1 [Araneus ventricosus]